MTTTIDERHLRDIARREAGDPYSARSERLAHAVLQLLNERSRLQREREVLGKALEAALPFTDERYCRGVSGCARCNLRVAIRAARAVIHGPPRSADKAPPDV
jgi:hypothetical protein